MALTRGPVAKQALRFAARRYTQSRPRFADGVDPNEKGAFNRQVDRRYNENLNRPIANTNMRDIFQNRFKYLKLSPQQQTAQKVQQAQNRQVKQDRLNLDQYLGSDETYQGQEAMLSKAMEDYLLSLGSEQGRVNEDYNLANQRMGEERTKARGTITEDFGARGVLHSGIFNNELGEYDTQYNQVLGDLNRSKDRQLEDLLEQRRLFEGETNAARQSARAETIRRYAAQEGIGLSSPTPAAPAVAGPAKDPYVGALFRAIQDGRVTAKEMAGLNPAQQAAAKAWARKQRSK